MTIQRVSRITIYALVAVALIGAWAIFFVGRPEIQAPPAKAQVGAPASVTEKAKKEVEADIQAEETGDVVITEIMYRPRRRERRQRYSNAKVYMEDGDDPSGQYVEIFNPGQEPIRLAGFKFTNGISFEFPAGSKIDAGAYVVVCRDPVALSTGNPKATTFGPFTGSLSAGGERLTLSDANNVIVDSVRYNDRPPWPIAPDESGVSLEVIDPFEDNNSALNWRGSRASFGRAASNTTKAPSDPPRRVARDGWFLVTNTGSATSNRLYFYLDGAGEWLVDDVSFRVENNNRNLLPAGSFNAGERGWMKTGNHRGSFWNRRAGRGATGCMQIRATAVGGSSANSLQTVFRGARNGQRSTVSFRAKRLRGSSTLTCRMSGTGLWTTVESIRVGDEWRYRVEKAQRVRQPELEAAPGIVGGGTPGRQNSVFGRGAPPAVTDVEHAPDKPTSKDEVTVTATVSPSAGALASVRLMFSVGTSSSVETLDMFDDGAHGDGASGDGVFGARVAARPSQTLVHYRVRAEDADGRVTLSPQVGEPSETHAYFHYDSEIDTKLTVYHLFVPTAALRHLDRNRLSGVYQDCSLVVDGVAYPHIGVRYRGNGSRGSPKRQWKFRFNKGHFYDGNRILDTMIAMPVLQRIVFRIADHVGIENLESDLVRVHLNGEFWGLYIVFESPNSAWLTKHGYASSGEVYKARSVFTAGGEKNSDLFRAFDYRVEDYWAIWNKKVRPLEPPTHIRDLTDALNELPDSELLPWLDAHVDVDQFLTRWALYILLAIDDFTTHNYHLFLSRHPGGKWKWLSYDFDSLGRSPPGRVLYGDGKHGDDPGWQRNRLCEIVSESPTLKRLYFLKLREMVEHRCRQVDVVKIAEEEANRSARDRVLESRRWGHSNGAEAVKAVIARQTRLVRRSLQTQRLPGKREVPKVTPAGVTFDGAVSVRLAVSRGWTAYYTVDGSDPRLSKWRKAYRKPIRLDTSTTLRAAAAQGPRGVASGDWTDLVEKTFEPRT